jgi:hypothetical protein
MSSAGILFRGVTAEGNDFAELIGTSLVDR